MTSHGDRDAIIALLLRAEQNGGNLKPTDLITDVDSAAFTSADAILAALQNHHALNACLKRGLLQSHGDLGQMPPVWFTLTPAGKAKIGLQTKSPVSERQQVIIAEAKRAAKAQGLDWNAMSRDERSKLRAFVREDLIAKKKLPRGNPARPPVEG